MAVSLMLRRAAMPLRRGVMRLLEQPQAVAVRRADHEVGLDRVWAPGRWSSSATTAAPADHGLLRSLTNEIENETVPYEATPNLSRGPPRPYTLNDTPGNANVVLQGSYGEEDIRLTATYQHGGFNSLAEGDDYDPDGLIAHRAVYFVVSIWKGKGHQCVEFCCTYEKDDLAIARIRMLETRDNKEAIFGSGFSKMDDILRAQFMKFILDRGINTDLCNYLLELLEDKERRENATWLHKVETFLKTETYRPPPEPAHDLFASLRRRRD